MSIYFKTGDGKKIKVSKKITCISPFLEESFASATECYFENTTEITMNHILDYYNTYLGLSRKQLKELEKFPYKDEELITLYDSYITLPYVELFGLLKSAFDMKIKPLQDILTRIVADLISTKSLEGIQKEMQMEKK